ncbi:DMT family transporter [Ancylobacter sp. 6x-1]|uniref:DMT family transporter n=1 Tax=Ancylobacter crimeensis TaxID=2579147 RepID=A0ABT0DD92_9HYPH|nr:DMT family transporter [Ancylobacter crimeensis]MCK0197933.1 DMT family transporter [Ancylobacter crimeensis]
MSAAESATGLPLPARGFSLPPGAALALAMTIAGTVGAFATQSGLDPVRIVFWRCVFGSLFLGAWCVLRGELRADRLKARHLMRAALAGVCTVLTWTCFFAAMRMTTIATATIVYHIQPFFVVLLGMALLGERASAAQLGWMALAFLGVVLASGLTGFGATPDAHWVAGIGMALVGAMLYAAGTLLAKGLGDQRPEVTAFCQTLTGIVLLGPFADWSAPIPPTAWPWLIGIGVLHTGIAYVLMYSAFPRLKTPAIAILTFVYPLVAIAVDWLIYGHPLGVAQGLGLAFIATGTIAGRLGLRLPLPRARRPS